MFFKQQEKLKEIIKFVNHRAIDTQDNPGISQTIDDISYQLTMVVKDMERVDKALQKIEKELKLPNGQNSNN